VNVLNNSGVREVGSLPPERRDLVMPVVGDGGDAEALLTPSDQRAAGSQRK
jgi:hypothetical protein